VVTRLKKAIDAAWQGYTPSAGAGRLVFGAKYLFENGSVLAGGMKRGLDESGELPVLTAQMDTISATRTYNFPNTVGISVNCAGFELHNYPYVKVCYGYDGMEDVPLTAVLNVNMTRTESSGFRNDVALTPGEDENGMKTATADLTAVLDEHLSNYHSINYQTQLVNLLFTPCAEDYDGDGRFLIRYVAFFKTADAAAEFDPNYDVFDDYLKNYRLGNTVDYREYTDSDREYYEKMLVDRIAEIKNAPSEVTPEQIKARGGTCWYVSSINGNDKNDGLSPEKPFKTLDGLVKRKFETSEGTLITWKTKAGDGVFFERGSVFYPEVYHRNMVSNLQGQSGVDYGAYGTGPKPLFTCTLDYDKVGKWHATEYPNVWMIDCVDDKPDVEDDGTENPAYWRGSRSEISNVYVNGGEGVGLRIVAKGEEQTLGAGLKSTYRGLFFNGYEYYESETRALDDPGTALLHNLEYFHDYGTGSLYLYWDKGDPNEYFDDIKASRNGTCAWIGNDSHVDNLAFLYSGTYCVEAGESNLTFTNCEIGFVHGALSSVESGIESFGKSDGIYMINNYIHDVGDGGLTSQCTANGDIINTINNVNYIGNVFVSVGVGAEIWNHTNAYDENGVSGSKITNCTIKDNIFAYGGWGMSQKQSRDSFIMGSCINGSMYGEFVNSRVEGNVFLYPLGCVYYAYVATYEQPRGWEVLGNVYVLDEDFADLIYSYETINYINHRMWKRVRIYFPSSKEGLEWLASQGVDPKGVFYHYKDTEPAHTRDGAGFFFMTGYYAERGENPSLIHD
ncbi:MAG: right-handed parallel beta-helix repeat-containing protein, partial [Clostridia bacterium]|nr:right-handed parallel beta-helix repeat-containing protein [Clostridia bacterium]